MKSIKARHCICSIYGGHFYKKYLNVFCIHDTMCVKREKAQLLFYIEELFKERDVNVMRKEHDFLGEMEIPEDVYYGVQTMGAV